MHNPLSETPVAPELLIGGAVDNQNCSICGRHWSKTTLVDGVCKSCASKIVESAPSASDNNARDEICAHCASVGAVKDYYPLAYVYCPYCGRKLSPVA